MKQDIGERQGFPSPTALTFSYEPFEGGIARTSATIGPVDIQHYEESPDVKCVGVAIGEGKMELTCLGQDNISLIDCDGRRKR